MDSTEKKYYLIYLQKEASFLNLTYLILKKVPEFNTETTTKYGEFTELYVIYTFNIENKVY